MANLRDDPGELIASAVADPTAPLARLLPNPRHLRPWATVALA
jgi:hypothetical protein